MLALPGHLTIPLHLLWLVLAFGYGVRPWSRRTTVAVLATATAACVLAIQRARDAGHADRDDFFELPLLLGVFLILAWHVQRRAAALRETELVAASERHTHEVKELFVRHASHEMRMPLTIARGYTDLVRSDQPEGQVRHDLGIVMDELMKLSALAEHLLELAAAYEPREFRLEPVDLPALVQRVHERSRVTAEREWVVAAEAVTIEGDGSRLQAAFDALVENAVKFTADGDRIVLRCAARGPEVSLEVEDEGMGFTASTEHGGLSVLPELHGTGLGLSIAAAVAEGHGGRLEVTDGPARGTVARIVVPSSAARRGPVSASLDLVPDQPRRP